MKYELLLPAGDLDRLKFACIYGADAVYIGGYEYSLRANANNFSLEDIKEAVKFAHLLNKKIYVTVNMIFHNEDLEHLDKYLIELDSINIDSFIVSDFAVIEAINRLKLKTPFFISTQKSITNLEAVNFYKSLGAYRVVLARECSREDIKRIKDNTDTEVEVFIHGAMCTSYSGRCVMSNYVTKRDSNRGGCSQVCRFTFNNDTPYEYAFSSKDLNMISYISDMMDMKIESYKVEGRMKSLYYIATVANAYRVIMDKKIDGTLKKDDIKYYQKVLNRCSNRENTAQFYNKSAGVDEQYFSGRQEISNKDFLGLVISYDEKTKEAIVEQRNKFSVGDIIEVFGPNTTLNKFKVKYIINDKNEKVISASHAQEIVKINIPFKVVENDILRVEIS
ncbi:MAG: U32 family peptidase [Tenericutes bacterium]|nr:U32 family peptidase [Mycoplasmatota bacterium]